MVNDELDRDKKGAYDRKTLMQHGYTKFPARAMHSVPPADSGKTAQSGIR